MLLSFPIALQPPNRTHLLISSSSEGVVSVGPSIYIHLFFLLLPLGSLFLQLQRICSLRRVRKVMRWRRSVRDFARLENKRERKRKGGDNEEVKHFANKKKKGNN